MHASSGERVIYWDASALLSCLIEDSHSGDVRALLSAQAYNLVSSLSFAEVTAVLSRLTRDRQASRETIEGLREQFVWGPWTWLNMSPDRSTCLKLSRRHALRGANLWHLACAAVLRKRLPELELLTYDAALAEAWERARLSDVDTEL